MSSLCHISMCGDSGEDGERMVPRQCVHPHRLQSPPEHGPVAGEAGGGRGSGEVLRETLADEKLKV